MLPPGLEERFEELKGGFTFACHPGVPCFNECCRKLNLVLTPYDVLRLKNRLGMTGKEFLDQYANIETGQNGWPQPSLAMNHDDEAACPFVSGKGCTVYEDRPGACRTYPLGRAAKGGRAGGPLDETFFLVREEHCRGFEEGTDWTPETWTADQGLELYVEMNDRFLPLLTRQAPDGNPDIIAKKMKMFSLACYDLESFRMFVTQTRLASMFDVPPERLEAVAKDDLELLKFAFDWLGFSIFGDPTMAIKPQPK